MEEALEDISESIEDVQSRFYGVVVGKVINIFDPFMLGRIQVQLPFIDSVDLSPWARIAVPMAGMLHGTSFTPSMNDEVLVAFEQGDVNAPYIIGSLWNATAPPPPTAIPGIVRTIRTPVGNEIIFSDAPPTITIMTPAGQTILMSPLGIQITAGTNVINMTPDGITMTGANINLTATTAVNIAAPNVNINSATATNVQSTMACNVTAPLVKIN